MSTSGTEARDSLVEALAEYAHEAWSGWMRYLFEKSREDDGGNAVIPRDSVERWTRQLSMSYADLPEHEKGADRQEARRMLAIIERMRGEA